MPHPHALLLCLCSQNAGNEELQVYYRDGDGLLLFRALAIMGQDLLLAFGAMVFVFFAVRTLATDFFVLAVARRLQ